MQDSVGSSSGHVHFLHVACVALSPILLLKFLTEFPSALVFDESGLLADVCVQSGFKARSQSDRIHCRRLLLVLDLVHASLPAQVLLIFADDFLVAQTVRLHQFSGIYLLH